MPNYVSNHCVLYCYTLVKKNLVMLKNVFHESVNIVNFSKSCPLSTCFIMTLFDYALCILMCDGCLQVLGSFFFTFSFLLESLNFITSNGKIIFAHLGKTSAQYQNFK